VDGLVPDHTGQLELERFVAAGVDDLEL